MGPPASKTPAAFKTPAAAAAGQQPSSSEVRVTAEGLRWFRLVVLWAAAARNQPSERPCGCRQCPRLFFLQCQGDHSVAMLVAAAPRQAGVRTKALLT